MSRGREMSDLPRNNAAVMTSTYLPQWCDECEGEVIRSWQPVDGMVRLLLMCAHCSHVMARCDVYVVTDVTERPAHE